MIEVKNLHKYFGELQVLRGIDETIKDGEVVCVIGPSGCTMAFPVGSMPAPWP